MYIISYALLTLWSGAAAGAPNVGSLLVFRFFGGFFGSSPLANAGGTISDVLNANQRGLGMALFAAAPFLGPALGPITGGFLGLTSGWRWVEGFLTILSGVLLIVGILFAGETYAPTLLRQRAERLSKVTGNVYRFRADAKKPLDVKVVFKASIIRPWKFLFLEPIVAILSIYVVSVIIPLFRMNICSWATGDPLWYSLPVFRSLPYHFPTRSWLEHWCGWPRIPWCTCRLSGFRRHLHLCGQPPIRQGG